MVVAVAGCAVAEGEGLDYSLSYNIYAVSACVRRYRRGVGVSISGKGFQ